MTKINKIKTDLFPKGVPKSQIFPKNDLFSSKDLTFENNLFSMTHIKQNSNSNDSVDFSPAANFLIDFYLFDKVLKFSSMHGKSPKTERLLKNICYKQGRRIIKGYVDSQTITCAAGANQTNLTNLFIRRLRIRRQKKQINVNISPKINVNIPSKKVYFKYHPLLNIKKVYNKPESYIFQHMRNYYKHLTSFNNLYIKTIQNHSPSHSASSPPSAATGTVPGMGARRRRRKKKQSFPTPFYPAATLEEKAIILLC